ncbi:MAG: FAD-dependent oxidoreductase [Sphingobacteriales bacterium]|nr:FAD-dependent oxidoreductase [Sphingobacteriales bacterium]OJV98481.1 MAG: CoA-disulfide reductase [Sphingobacteriales bacterium 44-61]
MLNHVIIGGSDAGISAALRIKELAPGDRVQMILKDAYPNFSICGIPFFLSGEIEDWRTLSHRTIPEIEEAGIEIISGQEVISIDPDSKNVVTATGSFRYDKLLLGTGATSVIPSIIGLDLPGVFTLRWIDDMLVIEKFILENKPRRALIIGGGYIGVEMADALTRRGLNVTLIESGEAVLHTLDTVLGKKVGATMSDHGVNIVHRTRISRITQAANELQVEGENGFQSNADLIIVVTGAKPAATLLKEQGIKLGIQGAYKVNRQMQSSIPDIFVAGDCGETWSCLLQDYAYMPLGTTAHKQGRVAGENMAGGRRSFQGSVGTQVVKVFDIVAGRTGFHDRDCEKHNIPSLTVESTHWDHKVYYPGAQRIVIRLTGNSQTGDLLGMQIIGPVTTEVSKRIDIAACAIQNHYSVEQLMDLDLSYTPPLSSPWDPVQMAAQAWLKEMRSMQSMQNVSINSDINT